MPELEFWFGWNTVIAAGSLVYSTWLAVMSLKSIPSYYRLAVLVLPLVAMMNWWNTARLEAEKAKPDRDFFYFSVSHDARDFVNGQVGILSVSTGVIRNARVAIQSTEDDRKSRWNYTFAREFSLIDEGENRIGVYLSPGDYAIDLDAPTKLGKTKERLQIFVDKNGGFREEISLERKFGGEVLLPAPYVIPFLNKVIIFLFALAFMTFAVPLFWISSRASKH